MNPGYGWMLMMHKVPVMIQPKAIDGFPKPEIPCAARYMPFGAVMMNILHGRPCKTKTEIHDRVVQWRNMEKPDDRRVQADYREAFQPNQSPVRRVERFHECVGRSVKIPIFLISRKREKQEDHISQDNHNPVTT